MTILADFLRDSQGKSWRIFPNSSGQLVITDEQLGDGWSNPSYTIPSGGRISYQTLSDSAGTTWYLYLTPGVDGEFTLSPNAPTQQTGVWSEPIYGIQITPTEATVGSEIYLALQDSAGTDWYVYPNADGELVLAPTEPS